MLLIWNKIIRKISQILTHKNTLDNELKLNSLKSKGRSLTINDKYYELNDSTHQYKLRKNSSDYEVFKQVVIKKEYEPLINYFKVNNIHPNLIIDCGANIGLTSIQFASNFPTCKIIAIEPDRNNFELLKTNTLNKNITSIHKAIWSIITTLNLNRNFRDGKDWSLRTVTSNENTYDMVNTTTINEIIKEYKIDEIDLLKIDIEGAEVELFKNSNYYTFLRQTKCIAIEIHDECVDRESVYKILRDENFILFNSGELTIGIKR